MNWIELNWWHCINRLRILVTQQFKLLDLQLYCEHGYFFHINGHCIWQRGLVGSRCRLDFGHCRFFENGHFFFLPAKNCDFARKSCQKTYEFFNGAAGETKNTTNNLYRAEITKILAEFGQKTTTGALWAPLSLNFWALSLTTACPKKISVSQIRKLKILYCVQSSKFWFLCADVSEKKTFLTNVLALDSETFV